MATGRLATRSRRAWLLLARGRDEAAIADLRAALEHVPYRFLHPFSYGFAGTLLALALAAAGERRDARRAAKRALRQAAQARRPTPASASYDGRHDEALVARAERALTRADPTR